MQHCLSIANLLSHAPLARAVAMASCTPAAAAAFSRLGRWRFSFHFFVSINDAIEAADPAHICRDECRLAVPDILDKFYDATDDHQSEGLRRVLDDLMAEHLETLRLVPATVDMLASTDLVDAVRAMGKHQSERVRVLAKGILSSWREAMQEHRRPKAAAETRKRAAGEISEPPAKKAATEDDETEAARRKLLAGYEEDDKRRLQRKVQLIVAPEMVRQRQRKMNPILRERSQARCGSSMVRSFSVSRLRKV